MDSNGFNNEPINKQQSENTDFFSNGAYDEPTVPDKGAIFAEKIRAMFRSNAYLTATIAYTVMASASLIWGNLDVFAVLFTVGMWIAYTAAAKGAPLKEMKFLSGVLKAYYILTIVGIVCMIVSGVICMICGPMVINYEKEVLDALKIIETDFGGSFYFTWGSEVTYFTAEELAAKVFELFGLTLSTALGIILIIIGVVLVISAVVLILMNEFFVHKLSKQFVKAIAALTLNTDAELCFKTIRVFATVLGVLTAISAASAIASFDMIFLASEGAYAVAYFAIASALKEPQEQTATSSTAEPML